MSGDSIQSIELQIRVMAQEQGLSGQVSSSSFQIRVSSSWFQSDL